MREFSLNYQIILKSIPHNLTISSPSGFTPLDEFFSVTGKKNFSNLSISGKLNRIYKQKGNFNQNKNPKTKGGHYHVRQNGQAQGQRYRQ